VWLWVKDLFVSVWESIKGVVMGFVEWLSPVIDAIIAPFKAIGNVIGGIINTVGGWFGSTVELGKSELVKVNENKAAAAASKPTETATTSAAATPVITPAITPPIVVTTSATAPPIMAAQTAGNDAPVIGGGNPLLNEHLAAAARKGIGAAVIDTSASDAFMPSGASIAPVIDMPGYDKETGIDFTEALRPAQTQSVQAPWVQPETKPAKSEPHKIEITNLYLQSDDTLNLLNFVRELEHMVLRPVEAAV
jgi:hypothetical protein